MPPKAQKLLTGKTVVFTGTLSMPRNVAALMAQRSGATVVSTVTGACNVIVAGPGAGSKLDKAASKGVEVWTEAEFLRKMTVEEHDERLASNNARVIEDTGNSKFQFSLSWDAFVDLDIHLVTPKGICSYQNRNIAGAELDVDRMPNMNSKAWDTLPVENIVCDKAFPGKYTCKVVFFSAWAAPQTDVPFTVRSRVGTHDVIYQGTLHAVKDEQIICTFTVGADGQIASFSEASAPAPAAAKAARKAPAKAAVKKVAPKKAAVKKPAAKKAAPKKPAAKKAAAKKPVAKKPAPKAARKTTVKAAAKKPAAKKAAPKRK